MHGSQGIMADNTSTRGITELYSGTEHCSESQSILHQSPQ